MGRPANLTEMPDHPAIVSKPRLTRYLGRARVMVTILCPRCQMTRARPASETRVQIQRSNFKGYCHPCSKEAVRDGTHRWINRRQKSTSLNKAGYVLVTPDFVSDVMLPFYRAMQRSGQPVLEHRLVMAQRLGRPLRSDELVDHMNGNKTDNRIENLRLYIRGKQQPGSAPGHGTYYDEWQAALSRIRELEAAAMGR